MNRLVPLPFKNILSVLGLVFLSLSFSPAAASPAALIPICQLQGSGFSSRYQGVIVRTQGVVTVDMDQTSQRGFFLQAVPCDGNSTTSDGIFVYLGERIQAVSAGDLVEASGLVQEYYGMTEIKAAAQDVLVLSHGSPLPAAQELNPPFSNDAARSYFETLEGMLVQLSAGRVVGPTDSSGRSWLVRADLGVERVFHDDPLGTGELICSDDGGLFEIEPPVKVGDAVQNLNGVLDFRIGLYCMQLTEAPLVLPEVPEAEELMATEASVSLIDIATFNLEELFDTLDDPLTEDRKLSYTEYQRRLQKHALAITQALHEPALLAVQEAENLAVLQDLARRPEIQAAYEVILVEGIDRRGLDVALLYRTDFVNPISYQAYQGCTGLIDGLEPDGNGDAQSPQNEITCDRDGDTILDGNRLFSRPPLVVHLLARLQPETGYLGTEVSQVEIWLVICHFKSKVEDTRTVQYTLPRRIEQARFVAGLVNGILAGDPQANVFVLGDLNDHPQSQPLLELAAQGFHNPMGRQPRQQRYTYIYQGISQTLDYILTYTQPHLIPVEAVPFHINADYPASYSNTSDSVLHSSDHDPVVLSAALATQWVYLPWVSK